MQQRIPAQPSSFLNGSGAHLLRSLLLMLLIATSFPAHGSSQPATPDVTGCVVPVEPNDGPGNATALLAGEGCAVATIGAGEQDVYRWDLDEAGASGRWTFGITGIPGQAAMLEVYHVEIDEAGTITVAEKLLTRTGRAGEAVSHDELLWPAGTYYLAVAASGPGDYVLTVTEEAPLPTVVPAGEPRQVAGAFGARADAGTGPMTLAWTVDAAASEAIWMLRLQGAVGAAHAVSIAGPDGTVLATLGVAANGMAEMPDIAVAPGTYTITTTANADATTPHLVEMMETGQLVGNAEAEPNDMPAGTTPVPLVDGAAAITGRLATTGGDQQDHDRFLLEVGPGDAGRLLDIRVLWQAGPSRTLCLFDATDAELRCAEGERGLAMNDLVLQEGAYRLDLRGAPEPDATYVLRVEVTAEAVGAFEAEPNDKQDGGSPMALEGEEFTSAGRLAANDVDIFQMTVSGEPQVWRIEVTGPGVSGSHLMNAAGMRMMSASVGGGEARIEDAYLVPGDHWIEVTGASGDYAIRAIPLGPPDRQHEREPNDLPDRSQPIRLDEERTGRLPVIDDMDIYRFSLPGTTYVEITITPPADGNVTVDIDRDASPVVRLAPGLGEPATYRGRLLPGNYFVAIAPGAVSEEPYAIRLAVLDPFDVPADLEPNGTAGLARPLPSGTARGTLDSTFDYGTDHDWYRIEAADVPRMVMVRADAAAGVALAPAGDPVLETPVLATLDSGMREVEIPAGEEMLLHLSGTGDYEIVLPGWAAAPGEATVELELEVTEAAAYWPEGQRIPGTVAITNDGDGSVDALLRGQVGHVAWGVTFDVTEVTLAPGERVEVPVTVVVAPDAHADVPVPVAVEALGASAMVLVVPGREVVPQGPFTWDPLPESMLGGMDVAWTALGGTPVAVDEAAATAQAVLHDGIANVDTGWRADASALPVEITVDLAGEDPVPVVGTVLLGPGPEADHGTIVRGFELDLSLDGVTWESVLVGELALVEGEQAFSLEAPVEARMARLRVTSTQVLGAPVATLGAWKVVAEPGWRPGGQIDLGSPVLGGHVVDLQPPPQGIPDSQLLLTDDDRGPVVRMEPGAHASWVVGFHHDRAAEIVSLGWADPSGSDPARRLARMTVEVSTGSPAGPWEPVGEWHIAPDGAGMATFAMPPGTWARFVRFTAEAPAALEGASTVDVQFPDRLIFIEGASKDSRSILGEWGDAQPEAAWERLVTPDPLVLDTDAGDDAASATRLAPGSTHTDSAAIDVDEDWFSVAIPSDAGTLALTLTGTPTLGTTVTLFDAGETPIQMQIERDTGDRATYTAAVTGGETYLARVTQPPTSVVIAFDTSASIGTLTESVYQGLYRFASDVVPGREFVNVIPFGEEPLLEAPSDDPYEIQGIVAGYPRTAGSSDAEGALLSAMEDLDGRDGTRAIILITDAESGPTKEQMEKLWPRLGSVGPRVYAVMIAGSSDVYHGQDLMQDWALVNGGSYDYVRDQAAMDVAFDRAATELRRPAVYTITADATAAMPTPTPMPEPTPTPEPTPELTPTPTAPDGSISVLPPPPSGQGPSLPASPDTSVAIILDTSGSMLQPLEDGTRADVAKSALIDLVTTIIPAGTTVSLRAFGDTPDSCETRLIVPGGPLDPEGMSATIASLPVVNLVRTPIGASLEAVAGDLGQQPGPKIVVLVTDGEETCDGDPAAAIEALIASGIDVRINIVGFAIDDAALRAQFTEWANLGNGQYIDAGSADELNAAVASAVLPSFEVVDANGLVVASGQLGGPAVAVSPGTYQIKIITDPVMMIDQVTVTSGQEVTVTVDPSAP